MRRRTCIAADRKFTTLRHAGQTCGDREQGQTIPYINHLSSVAG